MLLGLTFAINGWDFVCRIDSRKGRTFFAILTRCGLYTGLNLFRQNGAGTVLTCAHPGSLDVLLHQRSRRSCHHLVAVRRSTQQAKIRWCTRVASGYRTRLFLRWNFFSLNIALPNGECGPYTSLYGKQMLKILSTFVMNCAVINWAILGKIQNSTAPRRLM